VKRRKAQEHDEAIARAQADERREHLLAELRAHQAPAGRETPAEEAPAEAPAPAEPEPGPEAAEPTPTPEAPGQ
jgi:hypothetical protein